MEKEEMQLTILTYAQKQPPENTVNMSANVTKNIQLKTPILSKMSPTIISAATIGLLILCQMVRQWTPLTANPARQEKKDSKTPNSHLDLMYPHLHGNCSLCH